MARSSGFFVATISPWAKERVVVPVRTPRPTWSGLGAAPPAASGAPALWIVSESRSSNSARTFLKPVVLTLARLLETTSIRSCWASMPVAAVKSERSIVPFPGLPDAPDLDHPLVEPAVRLDGLHGRLEGALGGDHRHRALEGGGVAELDLAGPDPAVVHEGRLAARGGPQQRGP